MTSVSDGLGRTKLTPGQTEEFQYGVSSLWEILHLIFRRINLLLSSSCIKCCRNRNFPKSLSKIKFVPKV
jgi:hypothetical protein